MVLPPPGDIAIVVAGALAAGFVNGLSGTGYALVALGFWLQAMSPLTAAPLTALCGVAGHIQSLPRIWSGVRWSRPVSCIQAEAGDVATPFERRSPALEAVMARRYFRRSAQPLSTADLAYEMRKTPVESGDGPYDYDAEL